MVLSSYHSRISNRGFMKMISEQLPYLPLEMITNILILLPVKTLIRFKCVSKLFLSLISNPQFINTHLHISSRDLKFGHFRLITHDSLSKLILDSYSLHPVLDAHHYNTTPLDYLMGRHPVVKTVGSVNGLLCIDINEQLVLWNPSTRVLKRLPGTGLETQRCFSIVYGFGFDEHTNDYKVVGMFCPYESGKSIIARIYSLRADSWKIITDFPRNNINIIQSGEFTNGSFHWAVMMKSIPCLCTIVSFDLLNETYGEIDQPNNNGDHGMCIFLGVLQGCLSVLVVFGNNCSDLWVMKEYGVKDSWQKLGVIKYVGRPAGYMWYLFPLLLSSSGELLIEASSGYYLYNPKNGTFRYIGFYNCGGLCFVSSYVESLVSPYIDAA